MLSALALLFLLMDCHLLTETTDCSHSYVARSQKGVLRSYNYPFNYQNKLNCTYTIYFPESNFTTNEKICFQTKSFFLENSSPFCSFDYLKIGVPGNSYKYCGSGVWQYGIYDPKNDFSSIWSQNLCWPIKSRKTLDVTFVSDNITVERGFYIEYFIVGNETSYPRIEGQAPCSDGQWTCFDRQCIALDKVCDGANDCSDKSDESYIHGKCFHGRNIFACDIMSNISMTETYCGLVLQGFFLEEDLNRQYYLKTMLPLSSVDGLNVNVYKKQYCFSIWYMFYSESINENAEVVIFYNRISTIPEWKKHFKRQNQTTPLWQNLQLNMENVEFFEPKIEFTTGENSWFSIRDISLSEGLCSDGELSCNFATSLCGWTNAQIPNFSSTSTFTLKSWDFLREPETNQGFANLDLSSIMSMGTLMSPSYESSESHEIHVEYYIRSLKESDLCYVSISILLLNNSLREVWSGKGKDMNEWQIAQGEYKLSEPHQIAINGFGESCFIFVKKIAIDQGFFYNVPIESSTSVKPQSSEINPSSLSSPSTMCNGTTTCNDYLCMSKRLLCNGVMDCWDGRDESNCIDVKKNNSDENSTQVPKMTDHLGSGEMAGIILGCILVVALIVAAIFVRIKRMKSDKSDARRSESTISILGQAFKFSSTSKPPLPSVTDLQRASSKLTHGLQNTVHATNVNRTDANFSFVRSDADVLEFPHIPNLTSMPENQASNKAKSVYHVYEEPQYIGSNPGIDETSPSSSFSYIQRPKARIREDNVSLELWSPMESCQISSIPVHWSPQITPQFNTSPFLSKTSDNSLLMDIIENPVPKKRVSIDPRHYILQNYRLQKEVPNLSLSYSQTNNSSLHSTNV